MWLRRCWTCTACSGPSNRRSRIWCRGRPRAMLRTGTQGGSPKMTDEELAALGTWVRAFHGVEIDPEKLKDLGRTAGRLERTVRDAAAELDRKSTRLNSRH